MGETRGYGRNLLILIVGGAILIWLFISHAGVSQTVEAMKRSRKPLLLLAVSLQFLNVLIIAVRWRYLLEKVGSRIPLNALFTVVLAGNFMNNITPGARVGGEAYRAYLINRRFGVHAGEGIATILVERLFDFAVLFAFFIASYLYLAFTGEMSRAERTALSGVLLATTVLFILFALLMKKEELLIGFFNRFPGVVRAKLLEALQVFRISSSGLIRQRGIPAVMVLLTVLLWATEVIRPFFVFLALGVKVPFVAVALVTIVTMFVSAVPLFPGGLGVAEGTMLATYASLGIPTEVLAVVIVVDRAISYWLLTGAGGLAALRLGPGQA